MHKHCNFFKVVQREPNVFLYDSRLFPVKYQFVRVSTVDINK